VFNLRFRGERVSSETLSLVEEMADRLALALESARLFEETQSRVRRERTIRQITEQVRRAVDVETILQTTVAELGEIIGAPRVYVRLGAGAEDWLSSGRDTRETGGEPVGGVTDQTIDLLDQVSGSDVRMDGGDGAGQRVSSRAEEQPDDLLDRVSGASDGLDGTDQEGSPESVGQTTDLLNRIAGLSDRMDEEDRVDEDSLPDDGDQMNGLLDQPGEESDREHVRDEDQVGQDVLAETGDRMAEWLDQFRSELDFAEFEGGDGADQDAPSEATDQWPDSFGDGSEKAT
jgi:hypothetical protein